jgi:hypothetical protein
MPKQVITMDRYAQMAAAVVAAVEGGHLPAEQALHGLGDPGRPTSGEQMSMVGKEAPRIEGGASFGEEGSDPVQEIVSVRVVAGDIGAFDAAGDHVMERTWGIEARGTRHGGMGYRIDAYASSRHPAMQTTEHVLSDESDYVPHVRP